MSAIMLRAKIDAVDRDGIAWITASSGYFSSREVELALKVFDEAMGGDNSGYRYLIAESNGRMMGYACWGRDEITESSFELYWIAVDDRCRSKGIGKRLLSGVEAAIKREGCGQLFIETAGREQYRPTRCFYEAQGYHQAALLPDYYSTGDARVIYSKRL